VQALTSRPDATFPAEAEVLQTVTEGTHNELASALAGTAPSWPSPSKESPNRGVETFDADASQRDEQARVGRNGGLATLPSNSGDVAARTYLIPTPPVALTPQWFGPGETVVVAGFVLPGMVRIGGMCAARNALHDPSMIDPALPVDRSSLVCTLIDENGLDYTTLAPRDRGAYLNWMMSGRRSPVAAGLAMLFFKSLERRTLDILSTPGASDELAHLATEMRALGASYGSYAPRLQEHVAGLSTIVEFGLTKARVYAASSRSPQPAFSPSLEVRIAVAQAAFDKAPLPADWALAWVLQDANSTALTSAMRCAPELQRLFRMRYEERYGAGVKLPVIGGPLVMKYKPVSAAFQQGKPLTVVASLTAEVPDSTPVRSQLKVLVETCLEELSSFSRFAGRSTDRDRSWEALVRLPMVVWPADATKWFKSLEIEVRKSRRVISLDVFRIRFGGQLTVSKEGLTSLFRVLGSFGVGVEPIEIATKSDIYTTERLALFLDSESSNKDWDTEDFIVCKSFVDLAMVLATSSGEVASEDKTMISAEVKRQLQLKAGHADRLLARIEVVQGSRVNVKAALKVLIARDEEIRLESVNFLTRLAFRDIESAKARLAALNQFRMALTFSRKEPVAVPPPAPRLPMRNKVEPTSTTRSSRPKTEPKRLKLDPVRVATVQLETAKVEKFLHGLFSDDDGLLQVEAASVVPAQGSSVSSTLVLDAMHRQLLGRLIGRGSWSRADLQALVGHHGLMLDGAMETLNEAVFDAFGVGIIEGDDPLEVNADVAMLILQSASVSE